MKQRMRVGVLASLIAAPVVVADATNTTSHTVQAAEINAVAAIDINDIRLNEIYNLSESTVIANIDDFKIKLNAVLPNRATDPLQEAIYVLMDAKLDYLNALKQLKQDATVLNNDIALLKTANADAIVMTQKYTEQYENLVRQYSVERNILDDLLERDYSVAGAAITLTPEQNATYKQVMSLAFSNLSNYTGTLENYIKASIPRYSTLQTFTNSVVKPKAVIDSNANQTIAVQIGTQVIQFDFQAFISKNNLANDADRQWLRDQTAAINLYIATQLSSDEKKILEAHKIDDGRTVAEIIKQANDDIAAADKVTRLIETIETTEFKSETTFASSIKAINTAYDKLTARGQQLVPSYDEKVAVTTIGQNQVGYMAADEVAAAIKALKPANTAAYRQNVEAARTAYDGLSVDYQTYVFNYSTLQMYEEQLLKAKAVETTISSLNNPPINEVTSAQSITTARTKYNELSAQEKKVLLQDVYDILLTWERSGKDSIKVNGLITAIKIENKNSFATNTDKAITAFDALGSVEQQNLVDLRARLKYMTPVAKAVGKYYALKLGATSEYRTTVEGLHAEMADQSAFIIAPATAYIGYSDDEALLSQLFIDLKALVASKNEEIQHAKQVEALIVTAKNAAGQTQINAIQTARSSYNALTANEKKIVNNLAVLVDIEKTFKEPVAVAEAIRAVVPTATSFESKATAAVKAYNKLTSSQKALIVDDIKSQLNDFILLLDFIEDFKKLKVTDASYRDDVTALRAKAASIGTALNSSKRADIIDALTIYQGKLVDYSANITESDRVVNLINALSSKVGQSFLNGVTEIETAYAKLSANNKKLVTNYKVFQNLAKDATAATKVVDLINNSLIISVDLTNNGYEKAMTAALTAYNKLTSNQKLYVYNYDARMKPYINVYNLVVVVNTLKPTSKTYREDVAKARRLYNELSARDKTLAATLNPTIIEHENALIEVQKVIDLIEAADPGDADFVVKLAEARIAYDRLATINSAYQKLVTNYKTLQDREKANGPVTSSVYEIKELEILLTRPFNDAADFVKKYQAAMKAYEKIPFENRQLITNRDVLLNVIYPVASTMEAIINIKSTSKTFADDIKTARDMYNALSSSDKLLVTNYKDLVVFETIALGGASVDTLIRAIPQKTGTAYLDAIRDARAAYDNLTATEKKSVTLYAQLQSYEAAVKNVQTAVDLIDGLRYASNLVSAYDKATAVINKLTSEQRNMVSNLGNLVAVAPAIEVYKMIANLKVSSESYAGTVQAAYAAYNRLSNGEKMYVTNFGTLQEAKNNIDKLSDVIAKIAEISPSSRNYAEQVEAAMALYNSLPAALKKLVTNYESLKNSQVEVSGIDRVRALIGEIDANSPSFVQKVVAARQAYDALTANQRRLISNYFMLEEYEKKLGTMF